MTKSLGMESEMLRDRITNLLLGRSGGWMQPIREMPEEKAKGDAEAILGALGQWLDDVGATVPDTSTGIAGRRKPASSLLATEGGDSGTVAD